MDPTTNSSKQEKMLLASLPDSLLSTIPWRKLMWMMFSRTVLGVISLRTFTF